MIMSFLRLILSLINIKKLRNNIHYNILKMNIYKNEVFSHIKVKLTYLCTFDHRRTITKYE